MTVNYSQFINPSHSGVGITPLSLLCWCHKGVTLVLVLLRCHLFVGVTLVLVSHWCHLGAGVTLVSWCHFSAGVIKLFKPTINYVYSKIIARSHLGYQQNNMLNCYVCGDPFTSQFSLKRHLKRKHAKSNAESKKEKPKIHIFTENGLKLRYPFSMMVKLLQEGEDVFCQRST